MSENEIAATEMAAKMKAAEEAYAAWRREMA
jgi:hypothetical protein